MPLLVCTRKCKNENEKMQNFVISPSLLLLLVDVRAMSRSPKLSKEDKKNIIEEMERRKLHGENYSAIAQDIAEKKKIKVNTILSLHQRAMIPKARSHGLETMTNDQKSILSAEIFATVHRHKPITLNEIVNVAHEVVGVKISKTWARRFVSTTEGLTLAKSARISKKRFSKDVHDETIQWIEHWTQFEKEQNVSEHNLFNVDETRVTAGLSKAVFVESEFKLQRTSCRTSPSAVCTFIPFVSAAGNLFLSVFVFSSDVTPNSPLVDFKADVKLRPWKNHDMGYVYYATTRSGYLNKELFSDMIDVFSRHWNNLSNGSTAFLLCDQLRAHMALDTMTRGLENNVHLCFLPANTSHFLQPLDDLPFATFKKLFSGKVDDIDSSPVKGEKKRQAVRNAMFEAVEGSMTNEVIKMSFSNTGIYPFKPCDILDNMRKAVFPELPLFQPQLKKAVEDFKNYYESKESAVKASAEGITKVKCKVSPNKCFSAQSAIEKDGLEKLEAAERKEAAKLLKRGRDSSSDAQQPPRKRRKKTADAVEDVGN